MNNIESKLLANGEVIGHDNIVECVRAAGLHNLARYIETLNETKAELEDEDGKQHNELKSELARADNAANEAEELLERARTGLKNLVLNTSSKTKASEMRAALRALSELIA